MFQEHFNVNPDKALSSKDDAISHAVTMMLENHTAVAGFHWRYGYNNNEFCDKVRYLILNLFHNRVDYQLKMKRHLLNSSMIELFFLQLMENFASRSVSMFFFRHIQPYGIRVKGTLHGIGRHTPEEQAELTSRDLKSINDILGENEFILGKDKPTTIDCTTFGHLAQFLYIPMAFPQKKFMQENCPNLVSYVNRMKNLMWPDWDEMCKKECMEGKMGYEWETKK